MASSYSDLERNADFAFYFSSPHLGSVAPRLPNTANTAFIQTRQVNLGNLIGVTQFNGIDILQWLNWLHVFSSKYMLMCFKVSTYPNENVLSPQAR